MHDNGLCEFERVCRLVYFPEILDEINALKQPFPTFIAHAAPRVEIVLFAAMGFVDHDDGGVFDPSHAFKRFIAVLRKGFAICVGIDSSLDGQRCRKGSTSSIMELALSR